MLKGRASVSQLHNECTALYLRPQVTEPQRGSDSVDEESSSVLVIGALASPRQIGFEITL